MSDIGGRTGRDLAAALRGGWPVVLILVMLLGAAAYGLASTRHPVYRAEARIFLNVPSSTGDVGRYVGTQSQTMLSTQVLTATARAGRHGRLRRRGAAAGRAVDGRRLRHLERRGVQP